MLSCIRPPYSIVGPPSRSPVSLSHYTPLNRSMEPMAKNDYVGTGQDHDATPPPWAMIMHIPIGRVKADEVDRDPVPTYLATT